MYHGSYQWKIDFYASSKNIWINHKYFNFKFELFVSDLLAGCQPQLSTHQIHLAEMLYTEYVNIPGFPEGYNSIKPSAFQHVSIWTDNCKILKLKRNNYLIAI